MEHPDHSERDRSREADPYDWGGRVGDSWAQEYERTDRSFAGLTGLLVERTRALSPGRLLDVGCGAGETAIAMGHAESHVDVRGIDLSERLITAARHRGRPLKNVRFEVADASAWRDPGFVPDTVISRHGVMFFASPIEAFRNLRHSAACGAQLIFSCFRDRSENESATEIGKLASGAAAPADPTAPGPFAFADKRHVTNILASAGWDQIAFEPVDWDYIAGAGADPVFDAVSFFQSIGPAATAIAAVQGAERDALLGSIADLCAQNIRNGTVAFNAAAWIVTARAEGSVPLHPPRHLSQPVNQDRRAKLGLARARDTAGKHDGGRPLATELLPMHHLRANERPCFTSLSRPPCQA